MEFSEYRVTAFSTKSFTIVCKLNLVNVYKFMSGSTKAILSGPRPSALCLFDASWRPAVTQLSDSATCFPD